MPRAIDLLLDEIIPSDLRGNLNDLSGSNVNDFLVDLYKKYPEQYKKISHDLGRLGAKSAYIQGETLGLEDFEPVVDKPLLLAAMNDEIDKARQKFGSSDQFKKARESIWVRYNDMMLKNTISGAKATNNRIGHAVISGARGKNAQMQAMLTTPGLYADSKGDIVPMFVENSFAEGLRPLEFAAGMFGARASVISTKAATAKGGDYGKLLSQASARLLVTDKDCGVKNGISYDIDDNTARNRILARDIGNFKAGTMLTREVLSDLKKNNINKIVARSPLTCNADGLCSQCVGMTFENKFPKVGEHVGITAANAVCLEENTEILMADGTVKAIKDIVPGEFVIGVDENGIAKSSKVLDNYDRGEQPCFDFVFKHQKKEGKLTATKNHRCVISKRKEDYSFTTNLMPLGEVNSPSWKYAKTCDYFTMPAGWDDTDLIDVECADVIGLMLGDGTTATGNKQTGMCFSCADDLLLEEFSEILHTRYENRIYLTGKHSYRISDENGGRQNIGEIDGQQIRNKLKLALMQQGIWGLKRTDKKLPDSVFNWNNRSVFAALAGLIVTDGAIIKNHILFSNTSKTLIDQVEFLLKTRIFPIGVSVTKSIKKGYENTPSYNLSISGTHAILAVGQAILPFMLGVKRKKLEDLISSAQNDICNNNKISKKAGLKIIKIEDVGILRTRDLYIEHPNHVFLTKDFIQVHNSEPVTQGALSAKHTGGQATQKGEYGGFPILSQFVQSPTEYVHKAITPDEDGQVSNIEEAPQGGYNVFINNKSYYVKPGYPLTVKVGQHIESGQPLSEGIVDARDVVEKVGLGAGRKYWVDRIQKIYKDSGLYADKKNLEIVARGTLDTVALDEEIDGVDAYMDDVVNYNQIKKAWKPTDAAKKPTDMALNKYLASDTLEHTIGTRVTPSIQKQFQEAGINELDVMDKKPPFSPNMDRLRTASHYNDDWLAGLSTSYLKKQLEDSSLRAATTNIKENQHWAPRIAVGVGFGENIKTTGKF